MIRAAGLLITGILGLALLVWAVSVGFTRASERTVQYQYIADALDNLTARPDRVTWGQALRPLDRAFTPADAAQVGTAMTHAWASLTLAQATGRPDILRDGFSGVALERAASSVPDAQKGGGRMVVLSQEARPQFYHLDGSVFQTDVTLLVARFLVEGEDLVHAELVFDRATTTLMNETNGWRIYTHEREDVLPVDAPRSVWSGPPLAGLNYYPALTPWSAFWPGFDEAVVAKDFALASSLGTNAVRIFLTTAVFSDPQTQPRALSDLARLLQLAEASGLQVVPTLFDLKPGYDPSLWAQDAAFLTAVLPVLRASPAVAFIDLKNEPDLDYAVHGRGLVQAWLATMATLIRHQAAGLPLTIGWSSVTVARDMIGTVDLVTYHDYAPLEDARASLARLRDQTDLPVMITEIGQTSYSMLLGLPASEASQAQGLTDRMAALQSADGVFVWTLHDFPKVEAGAVGASPWVQRVQERFGLFDTDGHEKPAAAAVRDGFARLTRD